VTARLLRAALIFLGALTAYTVFVPCIRLAAIVLVALALGGCGKYYRQMMCRRTYLSGSDWRQRLPDYRACLVE
jgi:hypothetical protein